MGRHTLIQIDTGYACGGVECDHTGKIVHTCPIFKWMKGKNWMQVQNWKRIQNWEIIELGENKYGSS